MPPPPASVWDGLLDAVAAVVRDTLDTVGRLDPEYAKFGLAGVPVVRRSWPAGVFPQDRRPTAVVGPAGPERLDPMTGEDDEKLFGLYPVQVTLYGPPATPGVSAPPAVGRWLLAARPAVRKALLNWLALAPALPAGVSLDDCDDREAGRAGTITPYFPVTDLDATAVGVQYRTVEPRT